MIKYSNSDKLSNNYDILTTLELSSEVVANL